MRRKLNEKDAAVRAAKADRDRWEAAANLVVPVLQANPDWKWRDAVAHLRASGVELPGNPYFGEGG
jgi:hypothetical protein